MNTSTFNTFKELFRMNRLGNKRSSGKDVKMLSKVLQYLFLGGTLLLMIFLSITFIMASKNEDFDIFPILAIAGIIIAPVLIYEFFIRLSLPIFLYDELPALYLLPIPKKQVAQFKCLYTSIDTLIITIFAIATPVYAAINYIYSGVLGLIFAPIFVIILLAVNKQVFILFKTYFSKQKILSLLGLMGYFATFFLISGWCYYQLEENNTISLFLNLLFPAKWIYALLSIFIGLSLYLFIASCNYKHILNFKIDQITDDKDSYKSNLFAKSKKFESFGQIGKQVQNDLLFILRTKKMRNILLIIPFSIFFFILGIYSKENITNVIEGNYFWFIYPSIFMYITYIPYESAYMDFYFTRKETLVNVIKSKYIISNIILFAFTLICAILVFISNLGIDSLIALYSFSPGLISFLTLQCYTFNKVAMFPETKTRMNKNFNAMVFLIMIVTMVLVPTIISVTYLLIQNTLLASFLIIGCNGMIAALSPLWIKNIVHRMNKNKYNNLESIRNSLR